MSNESARINVVHKPSHSKGSVIWRKTSYILSLMLRVTLSEYWQCGESDTAARLPRSSPPPYPPFLSVTLSASQISTWRTLKNTIGCSFLVFTGYLEQVPQWVGAHIEGLSAYFVYLLSFFVVDFLAPGANTHSHISGNFSQLDKYYG